MKKTIMIYAYFNFNLGDDLFIKILCERYPNTHFVFYAPKKYRYLFRNLPNITVYSSDNIFNRFCNLFLRKTKKNYTMREVIAKKSDAIVQIGGSIFMQKENWDGTSIENPKLHDKSFFVLGANFGPYSDVSFYQQHYELFKKYTDISFRDSYSYELFKELDNVRKADDIVFQMNTGKFTEQEKSIVISVIKPSYRKNLYHFDDIYYQKIKDIIVKFTDNGYEITLMSFCENEGDQEAINEIINLLPNEKLPNVKKFHYKLNIDEALNVINKSSYVIATRFHAMVLGWLYNKPVYPISYSKKMNNVMNDINYQGFYGEIKEIDKLNISEVYDGLKKNFVNISSQIENSEQHFKVLDDFLSK